MKTLKDYRSLLQGELEKRVAANPSYSLRAFARDLSLSPSRLSEIFSRKNGLSPKNAARISELLKLDSKERDWFYHSVCALHSRSQTQRELSEKELYKLKSTISKRILDQEEFKVIAHWYHLAILELMNMKKFILNPHNVSERLGLSELEATEAIERLKKFGWIRKEDNKWITKDEYRTVSSTTPSAAIRSFHSQLISKAEKAIHQQSIQERTLHGLVLSTNGSQLDEANKEIEKFCFEFNQRFSSPEGQGDKLYALSLQFFKLSHEEASL